MVGVIVRADRDAIYRFGVFEYNDRTGDLRKNGSKVRLQDQSRHVLAKLLARSGELVTREELRTLIWPEDTFVDGPHVGRRLPLDARIKYLPHSTMPFGVKPIARVSSCSQ